MGLSATPAHTSALHWSQGPQGGRGSPRHPKHVSRYSGLRGPPLSQRQELGPGEVPVPPLSDVAVQNCGESLTSHFLGSCLHPSEHSPCWDRNLWGKSMRPWTNAPEGTPKIVRSHSEPYPRSCCHGQCLPPSLNWPPPRQLYNFFVLQLESTSACSDMHACTGTHTCTLAAHTHAHSYVHTCAHTLTRAHPQMHSQLCS